MFRLIKFGCLFFLLISATPWNDSGTEPWGVDAELATPKPKSSTQQLPLPVHICEKMVTFYQRVISPTNGPRSSYLPSSSQYTKEAIVKYGVFKGIALGCDRLLRENGETWHYLIATTDTGEERKLDPVR